MMLVLFIELLLIFLAIAVSCSVLFAVSVHLSSKRTTRKEKRYPVHVPDRIRPPRAEPVDFATEIYEYRCRKDAYADERILRRVG